MTNSFQVSPSQVPLVRTMEPKVGDWFVATWGYDQTNVDFYRVTRKTKAMIELSPIPSKYDMTGDLAGQARPDLDAEPGAPIGLKRPKGYRNNGKDNVYVRMNSYSSARKIDDPKNYSTYVSWYA